MSLVTGFASLSNRLRTATDSRDPNGHAVREPASQGPAPHSFSPICVKQLRNPRRLPARPNGPHRRIALLSPAICDMLLRLRDIVPDRRNRALSYVALREEYRAI